MAGDRLRSCNPPVKALCNKAMARGHSTCNKQQKAYDVIGSKINTFLSWVSTSFGTEGVDGITTEANALEDDKEYQVCATLKMRIDDAVAQSPRKRKSPLSLSSTAITDINTTNRLKVALAVVDKDYDEIVEVYVIFDDNAE